MKRKKEEVLEVEEEIEVIEEAEEEEVIEETFKVKEEEVEEEVINCIIMSKHSQLFFEKNPLQLMKQQYVSLL